MATESITKALGSGSGIDLKALVASLVDAQYATKTGQLTTRSDALTAQISGVAKLKSAITGFDSALKSLVKGGTLATRATSSNSAALTVSPLAGGKVAGGLSVTLTVERLAAAQAATSGVVAQGTSFRGGALTVTIGTGDKAITTPVDIAAGATLADVAAAIKAKTGLAAALVADGDGTRLTVKGATGASQAFSIAAADADGDANGISLGMFATGAADGALKIGTTAEDATVVIDGARYTRSSNSVSNLVPGVRLELAAASTTPVTISAASPSASLAQAVSDFVDTYNQLRSVITEETNVASGALKSDAAATGIGRSLGRLTTTRLATASTAGGPQTLADVGVRTNRDGTLSIDAARLNAALTGHAADVEAMFADGVGGDGGGLSAAFSAIAAKLTDKAYGLDAAAARYAKAQTDLADMKAKAADDASATTARLTRQFASMDARVAAYKSTQTVLTQQIDAWNRSGD